MDFKMCWSTESTKCQPKANTEHSFHILILLLPDFQLKERRDEKIYGAYGFQNVLVNQVNQMSTKSQHGPLIPRAISFFFPTHARRNEEMRICMRAYGFQNVLVNQVNRMSTKS